MPDMGKMFMLSDPIGPPPKTTGCGCFCLVALFLIAAILSGILSLFCG